MRYRNLGNTGLKVSEIGLGAEWLERHDASEVEAVIRRCERAGINILDCWMSEPNVRSNIGAALRGHREKWIILRKIITRHWAVLHRSALYFIRYVNRWGWELR